MTLHFANLEGDYVTWFALFKWNTNKTKRFKRFTELFLCVVHVPFSTVRRCIYGLWHDANFFGHTSNQHPTVYPDTLYACLVNIWSVDPLADFFDDCISCGM